MMHPYRILDPSRREAAFSDSCALTIMAKAPIPGRVKTRLSPPLTPRQAAELNACFLRDTVANLTYACYSAPAQVVVSYTPTGQEAAFLGILEEGTALLPQRGGDFGERLLQTAQDLFACGFRSVCLIDSDSPTVPTTALISAILELSRPGSRAVLGPSADGGYYLIGLQRAESALFERISWSTDQVAAQTMERARQINLAVTLLVEWYDVDDESSLDRLREELSEAPRAGVQEGYAAPHTREYVQALGQSLLQNTRQETPA
jgi:rSAM/selenodomain-associated transferase 1